jgi:hypothetical protein
MSNWTARTGPAYAFLLGTAGFLGCWLGPRPRIGAVRDQRCQSRRGAPSGDSALIEGFLARKNWTRPSRPSGCTSRSPRSTSPTRRAIPPTTPDQFAGVLEFPYRSWDLNRLAFHPDLVDAVERYLGTRELHLYKVELWAKYGGAVDYDQPLHRDYGSHSLVVPRVDGRYQQLTTFIYLSDVTGGRPDPHRALRGRAKDVPFTPLYSPSARWPRPRLRRSDRREPARLSDRHPAPGLDFTGAGSLAVLPTDGFPGERGTTWGGKMAWPKQSPKRWAKLMPRCSVRERDLFGFPRPGDGYWNEQTVADVALRYPGMDMSMSR